MSMLAAFTMFVIFCYFVLIKNYVSVGSAGVCITYVLSLDECIVNSIKALATLENLMVSLERIIEYCNTPKEKERVLPTDENFSISLYPRSITFKNVFMEYRKDTQFVLNGISFHINPGDKVGIIGRTGSGKSSIFLALLRMVEISKGSIFIDNKNIANIGLQTLRKSISLVPQDPLVFHGTIQENVDPFEVFDSIEIEKILQEVQLGFNLDFKVKSGGKNLSIGQRQILSLCKAILGKCKIVLFDEATAGIDCKTDQIIQNIIRIQLKDSTILTIAHRIDTILDYSYILRIENGCLAQILDPRVDDIRSL